MDISEQPDTGRGPTYRAALIAVIILTLLLFAGLIALVAGFMRQYALLRGSVAGAPATITLAPGARVVSVETAPGKLILHVTTPRGDEVDVMDLGSGRLLTRIKPP